MEDEQITKWSDEEVIEFIQTDMDLATLLQDALSSQRSDYYKTYSMEAYGNERDGFSKSIAPVIHNHHKWTMANLMDIFTEDFFMLKGEDDTRAANFQKLIYYQMFRKQDGFRKLYDFIWCADLYHYAVLKCYYKEDFELETETHDELTPGQMEELMQNEDLTITKYDEEIDVMGEKYYKNVKAVTKKTNYAGPFFNSVPNWEFFYSPDCKITNWGAIEGRLVYHNTKKTLNDVRKKEKAKIYRAGTFDKLKEKFSESFSDPTDKTEVLFNVPDIPDITDTTPQADQSENILNRELDIRECYFRLDIDGDGLLEDVIADICDDVVCRLIENPYKRPPFRIGHVAPEPYKVVGQAMPALLDNDQKIQTNLLRLIQDSAAIDCYKNPVTNDTQMFNMLQDRKPFAVIKGDPQRLGEVKTSPPTDFVLKAMEMQEASVEKKTGMTRYNQGMDASSLNKTATGIDAIMAASSKPLRLIARILGTGAILGMIRDFIFINQLYPPKTDIRILGTDITVNPDDLTGEHDVEIDVGVSPAERNTMANQLDLLLQFSMQAGIPMGIMTPVHVLHIIKKKYKFLGQRVDQLMATDQEVQKAMEDKKNAPPKPPDMKEYVQLDKLFPLLTPMEQGQIIQHFGIQPDPSRQQMPPDALSGGSGAMGATGADPGQAAQEHAQGLQQSHMDQQQSLQQSQQKHIMSMKQQQQSHQQQMAQTAQTHVLDLEAKKAKNAMDLQKAKERPYPQGVKR